MEKDIGRVKKNEGTEIVVRIDDYKGKKGVTIREYITGERYTGFTKAGTRIPAEKFLEFRELVNKIDLNELKPEEKQKAGSDKSEGKKASPAKVETEEESEEEDEDEELE